MSAWKKRLIALALWVPFALYGANAVSRVELLPASFQTMPIDRETAAKLKASTKSKAEMAQLELQDGAGYQADANGNFKAALTERFSVTENAKQFNEAKPKFSGDKDIAKRFTDLFDSQSDLKLKRVKLSSWMKIPVPGEAVAHLRDFREAELKEFAGANPSADEVVEWELKAIHRCAVSFAKPHGEIYEKEVKRPVMPLTGSPRLIADTDALIKMHGEFTNLLQGNPVALNNPKLLTLTDRINEDFGDWSARRELLILFAEEPTAKSTEACKQWFEKVSNLYGKLKDEKTRSLIRLKVQHFCGAYIPVKMALDESIMVEGKLWDRKDLKVRYKEDRDGGDYLKEYPALTLDPEGLNEETAPDKSKAPPPRGAVMDKFMLFPGASTVDRPLVVPTKLSKASFEYLKERRILTTDDFSLATVTRTIGKIGPENEMVWNQLSRMNAKGEYNVYDRLKFLKEMIEKHQKNQKNQKNLFP